MTSQALLKPLAFTGLLAASASAFAHVGADAGTHHGFFTGFTHPLTGLDHLAAMLAVGMWSAMTTRRTWAAPLSFAALLLMGAQLAQAGMAFPAIEPMIAASLFVVGLLLASRRRLPEAAGALLAGAFALFHGAAHGQELSGQGALLGMAAGTAVLHAAGVGLGFALRQHSPWLPRLVGGTVALFGVVTGWTLLTI